MKNLVGTAEYVCKFIHNYVSSQVVFCDYYFGGGGV